MKKILWLKKLVALALVTLGVTVSARAQWIVYDPANTVQSVINTAQEIAKFVQMINNQVQQIQTLTDQLNEFKHYESLFGDPKAVLLTTVQPLVNDLRKTELGQTLTALEGAVDAGEAMLYDANGLFTSIGTTFNTPNGANVTRHETPYLPLAAVQKTTDNFLSVTDHRPLLKSGQTGTGSNCAGTIATLCNDYELAQRPATAVGKLPDSTKERA